MATAKNSNVQKVYETVTIEGVGLLGGQFRNFGGRKSMYNSSGKRQFSIRLDQHPDALEKMRSLGYSIKGLKPREAGDPEIPFITVGINCPGDNPELDPRFLSHVFVVTSRGKVLQDNTTMGLIDGAEITNVDLTIRPYNWSLPDGKHGVKPFVKEMYITIQEDPLTAKYN